MKRPDHTFKIVVSPVYYVVSCSAKLDEESRGLMGFHAFTRCPDCALVFNGWEFWGENGHMQGSARTREGLIHWLAAKAKYRQIVSGQDVYQPKGSLLGFRFVQGSAIYYRS